MGVDADLFGFLGSWLNQRAQEPQSRTVAVKLQRSAGLLARDETPGRFLAALTARVAGLRELLSALDSDPEASAVAANSHRGLWARSARRMAEGWDQAAWVASTLRLSAEKNPLILGAVSQALEEAAGALGDADLAADLRKLRVLDEREYRNLPVPPGPRTPWDVSGYILPSKGKEVALRLAPAITGVVNQADPAADLVEVCRLIHEGWPIARDRLDAAILKLAGTVATGSGLETILSEARGLFVDAAEAPKAPAPRPTPAVDRDPAAVALSDARDKLGEIARSLGSEPSADARSFGLRLVETVGLPSASDAPGLCQELVTVLASLDDPAGGAPTARWRSSTLEAIARICQGLGGGEVLDRQLVGQPLDAWTAFVLVLGEDDEGPSAPGLPRRISRVDRVGYRVVFSDGERRSLIRARVYTAR